MGPPATPQDKSQGSKVKVGLQTTQPARQGRGTSSDGRAAAGAAGGRQRHTSMLSSNSSSRRTWAPRGRPKKQQKPKIKTEQFKGISFSTMLRILTFARRWGKHFREKRAAAKARAKLEPTYRVEPVKPFHTSPVQQLIEKMLEERLGGWSYSPKLSAIMCRALTEELREAVKKLAYERYKYVTLVHIGQKNEQGLEVTSRCMWDERHDNFVSAAYSGDTFFANALVFAIFTD